MSQEHVLGLEITMDDALGMSGFKSPRYLVEDAESFDEWNATAARSIEECFTEQEFHRKIGASVGQLADVLDGDDRRVLDLGERACFPGEALDRGAVFREPTIDHLDRDTLAEAHVPGGVDFAHRAGAEPRVDLVEVVYDCPG